MTRADDDTLPTGTAPTAAARHDEKTVALGAEDHPTAPRGDTQRAGTPASAAAAQREIVRAGAYVLGEQLAEGGFGVVYRAEHAERGTPAAVKILHAELAAHPDVLVRFEREVEAIRRVRHPNVVEVFEYGRLPDDGRPYFAMELLEGVNLEQHLRVRGRLPAEEVLAILEPLCSALQAAHAQAIVHRDIKPSNVFLSERGGAPRVVLLDFGVAKLLDLPGPALTSSRHVVGTLACIAPEQLLAQPVDARTDVYALGSLTYTMLTGEPPFSDTTYPVLRQLHLYASPPRPSARARVSAAFDDVVLRAMSKDREARHPTIAAFLGELRAAAEQARAAAGAPGRPGPRTPAGGTSAPDEGAPARRALGVHVEILADAAALEDPDDRFLADYEAILPLAVAALAEAGFTPAIESGNSALFTAPRPDDAARDAAARRDAVRAAIALDAALARRGGADPRIRVRACVHAGEIVVSGEGALAGGDLLELAAWVPEGADDGVFASPAVLAGLGIEARPAAPAAEGGPPALLRVMG